MPQPTIGDVHVNRPLTNISVAYMNKAEDYIANKVFPIVPVQNRSDSYYIWDSADFRRNNAKPRAPGTESAGGGMDLNTGTYTCDVFAFHKDVADMIAANADPGINLESMAARFVMQQLLIQKEINWMNTYFTTGVWGTDVVGTTDFTKWHDASSDPEKDIDTGKATIRKNTGLRANTLVVDFETHQALKRHPLVTERYKHTTSNNITADILARFFEIDRYIVAGASYTTSEEGAASETNSFIAGQNALLCYVPSIAGLEEASAGYTFAWRNYTKSVDGVRTKRFYMDKLGAMRIEGEFAYDQKLVSSAAGYFFSDTVD